MKTKYEITDMKKYGITGKSRWDATVTEYHSHSIQRHGVYFPTKRQAQEWIKKQKAQTV